MYRNKPIPVAVRSKARVCGRSSAGITGSKPAEGLDAYDLTNVVYCTDIALCGGPIPRPEESYRVCTCLCLSSGDTINLCTYNE